jgi:hypothetical protein
MTRDKGDKALGLHAETRRREDNFFYTPTKQGKSSKGLHLNRFNLRLANGSILETISLF